MHIISVNKYWVFRVSLSLVTKSLSKSYIIWSRNENVCNPRQEKQYNSIYFSRPRRSIKNPTMSNSNNNNMSNSARPRYQQGQDLFGRYGNLLPSNGLGNFTLPPAATNIGRQPTGPNPYSNSSSTVRVTPGQNHLPDPYDYMVDLSGLTDNDITAAGAAATGTDFCCLLSGLHFGVWCLGYFLES